MELHHAAKEASCFAASAALSVIYPHMTSVGGDAFWLIHDTTTKTVRYIDGGGRATRSGTIEAFARRGLAEVPYRGPLPGTLTVPGAVASWAEAHAAYGRLPLARCLESAIGYARDGFPVTARLAHWRETARAELAKCPHASAIFLKDGNILTNPALARTLEAIASDGWYGFYEGEVAQELLRYSAANDGFFAADDLKAQQARWGEPLKGTYRGVTIYETPAPTQGFAVLEMLNLLEPLDMAKRLLDSKGVSYQEIPVDMDVARRAEMEQRSGRRTVPLIWIGERHVGGYDDLAALERLLKRIAHLKIPVISTIWPLADFAEAQYATNECNLTVPATLSTRIAAGENVTRELVAELRKISAGLRITTRGGSIETAVNAALH